MGKVDRGFRLVAAALILFVALGTTVTVSGLLFWVALLVAGVFILTAIFGNCPLYSIIGLKTCQNC